MSRIIKHLKSFNRKERFILLKRALGPEAFRLDCEFRKELGDEIGVPIPDCAFVAMDYHLDWLQVAMYFTLLLQVFAELCGKSGEVFGHGFFRFVVAHDG